jgi:prospero homeobox 1
LEKYARQALAEGVRNVDDISASTIAELYRVFNMHYNRNNHIPVRACVLLSLAQLSDELSPRRRVLQVPPGFREVVETTMREFVAAIQECKDEDPSWKKAIYKVIARLDDPIPDHFKTPNFLEQLE